MRDLGIPENLKYINSWKQVGELVEFFSDDVQRRWLFRGVTNQNHDLRPKSGRARHAMAPGPLANAAAAQIERDEVAAIKVFRQGARAFHQGTHTKLEWMAIAQHFGAPTRLLDWSESFLVAAWFASQPPATNVAMPPDSVRTGRAIYQEEGAIYVSANDRPIDPDFLGDPFKIKKVKVYRPPHISPRIAAQSSVLMLCPNPLVPLEDKGEKIVINNRFRPALLRGLHTCGINAQTLFSDLAGVGTHTTWRYLAKTLYGHHSETFIDELVNATPEERIELKAREAKRAAKRKRKVSQDSTSEG